MIAVAVAAVALGCAAVIGDLRTRTIPNWLSGGGVAAGLACGLAGGGRARRLDWRWPGAAAGFARLPRAGTGWAGWAAAT